MTRALPLLALLALVVVPRLAAGGISSSDGPVKVTESARPALTGRVLSMTWVGRHGRSLQRLDAPRALEALGTLTPPVGEWDAVVLHLSAGRLELGEASVSLPFDQLELVLAEPVTGGAPLRLTLELSGDDLDAALGRRDAGAIQVALQDAAVLVPAPAVLVPASAVLPR